MATEKKLFDITRFGRGSRQIDLEKADLNLGLRFLRHYFVSLYERESHLTQNGEKKDFAISVEDDLGYVLSYIITTKSQLFEDGFQVHLTNKQHEGSCIIASNKMVAAAEKIWQWAVWPCHDLFDAFADQIINEFPPSKSLREKLRMFYVASNRAL